jgi:hypothetical protein
MGALAGCTVPPHAFILFAPRPTNHILRIVRIKIQDHPSEDYLEEGRPAKAEPVLYTSIDPILTNGTISHLNVPPEELVVSASEASTHSGKPAGTRTSG